MDLVKVKKTYTINSLCLSLNEDCNNIEFVLGPLREYFQQKNNTEYRLVVIPFLKFLEVDIKNIEIELMLFLEMASKYKSYIALGCCISQNNEKYFSSLLLHPSGKIIFRYDKTHNYTPVENITLGNKIEVCQTPFGKIGFCITTDIYYWDLFEAYKALGADMVIWQHYPEHLRDHAAWNFLLPSRAFDINCLLVCSMYADNKIYLTNRHSNSVSGSAFGQSMIINRNGAILAGTGYLQGCAEVTIKPHSPKFNPFEIPKQSRDIFSVTTENDYSIFDAIVKKYQKPKLSSFQKRTARVMLTSRPAGDNWIDNVRPDGIFELLEKAQDHKPDIIVFSEENTKVTNPATVKYLADISKWSVRNNCYILIGGIRNQSHLSIARLWDRNGKEVFSEAIYWSHKDGLDKIKVFDTDFARIGIRICGDLFYPAIDRCLALLGAEIIFDPSWMWGPSGIVNEMLARTRAFDNCVYTACSHFSSSDPAMRSFIIDYYGQILAATEYNSQSFCFADIDFSKKRVYYNHPLEKKITNTRDQPPDFYIKPVPQKKYGYREMLFKHRRPELYNIILESKKG